MSVAKVSEITSTSPKSFDDAIEKGVRRASKNLEEVRSAWIKDFDVGIKDGGIKEYRVKMKVTFVLKG